MKPSKVQFTDLHAERERNMELRTYALANRPVSSLKSGEGRELGFPMSGDAIARMRKMAAEGEKGKPKGRKNG